MKTPLYSRYSYCLLLCLQAVANGAEIPKLTNNVALNLPGAWNTNSVPGTGDVMLWNNLFAASATAGLSGLGGDMSVLGLKVTNVAGTANPTNLVCGFVNPTSANTLTIGANGIDMSAATQAILLQSKITLGSNQTWNVVNANTQASPLGFNNNEDLAMQSLAAASPFNLNGKTVTTSGNGYITITSGWVMSNGTIISGNELFVIQGGGSQVMNIQNNVNLQVNAGRLRLQNNSGAGGVSLASAANVTVNSGGTFELRNNNGATSFIQSGPITLNAGSAMAHLVDTSGASAYSVTGNITAAGNATWRLTGAASPTNGVVVSGALSGAGNIAYQNTGSGANGQVRLSGVNSGYTGTLTLNGASGNRALRLMTANSGSAAATWNVGTGNILQADGVAVQLGTLNGSGTVTNSHASNAADFTISAGNFTGGITNGLASTTSVTKTGTGTLVLSGPNTYTGTTNINQGTLIDSPDHTAAGAINVADGATFGTLVKVADTTLSTGNLTVGTTTGATAQFDFANLTNPTIAPLAVGNLFFHGPSTIKVIGKNLTTGTFPLLQYTTKDPGSTAVGGLGLTLPTRTAGTLSDNGSLISLNISATQQVKWNGDVNNDWDIDPDGTGAVGTPNWLTTVSNASTRYIQGSVGTDAVTFSDSASGGTEKTVNLTTTVTPSGLTFDNSTKNYTLTGSGKLSGLVGLEKKGTGMLTIANTTANDYSGGTLITGGSLRLGDGTTPGAGQVTGTIQNEGTLILNRPDNYDFANILSGVGTLEKAALNTVNFPQATTITTPITLTAGKLKFSALTVLSGSVSGPGEIEGAGGNLEFTGSDVNTNTGLTTISAGVLRLNKPADTTAVAGNIDITGGATLAILANEQVANTATIRALGTSTDSLAGTTGTETWANAVVNGVATTQMILRNNHVITGTGTVTTGILGVASAHTGSVNTVVMTSPAAILRIAGGSAASVLNIGSGGITASAGDVQVKFSATDFDATVNLAGNVTTTGNFQFSNAGYTGAAANIVNLTGPENRTFNIGTGTTTTFAPDLSSAEGSLTKSGGGTLTLNASCTANIFNGTTVSDGTLLVNGSLAGALTVGATGTVGGTGTLSGAAVVDGTVSPGTAIGTLTSTGSVSFGPDSDLVIGVGSWTGTTAGTDWDLLNAASLAFTATPSNPLTIHVTGTPTGFTEVSKTMVIATSTAAPTGFNPVSIAIDKTGFSGAGTFAVQLNGNNIELVYTAAAGGAYDTWASGAGLTPGNNGQTQDAENDGLTNREEFALDGNPLSGKSDGKVVAKLASVGGQTALTLTLPVRNAVIFSGTTELTGSADGVLYRIQASDQLGTWTLQVSEVTGGDATAIQAGLPALSSGWTYRTFRSPGPVAGDPIEFIRVKIDPS